MSSRPDPAVDLRPKLGFELFRKLGDPALAQAMLGALEGKNDARAQLTRANLLRRSGDLAGAKAAFAGLLAGQGRAELMADQWCAIPPHQLLAGFAIAPLVLIDDFLPTAQMDALHRHACAVEGDYVTRTSPAASHDRHGASRMLVNPTFQEGRAFFADFLRDNEARLKRCFDLPDFAVSHVELKLMNNVDGGYLTVHSDHNGYADTEGRAITCLYYFGRFGSGFEGGELFVLDSHPPAARFSDAWFTRVVPQPNRFIAFPSWFFHSVSPATGTDGDFSRGRMSVSCQIRKDEGPMDAWWEAALAPG